MAKPRGSESNRIGLGGKACMGKGEKRKRQKEKKADIRTGKQKKDIDQRKPCRKLAKSPE